MFKLNKEKMRQIQISNDQCPKILPKQAEKNRWSQATFENIHKKDK